MLLAFLDGGVLGSSKLFVTLYFSIRMIAELCSEGKLSVIVSISHLSSHVKSL